jgi:hypothetical protein
MAVELVKLYIRVNEQVYRFEVNEYWLWVKRQPDGHTIPYERLTHEEAKKQATNKLGKNDAQWNQRFMAWAIYDFTTGIWDHAFIHHIVDDYEKRRNVHD